MSDKKKQYKRSDFAYVGRPDNSGNSMCILMNGRTGWLKKSQMEGWRDIGVPRIPEYLNDGLLV